MVKLIMIDWNSYKKTEQIYDSKTEQIYNSKTNIWTDTRPLYYDNLTKSLAVYIPNYIIKYAKPLLFVNLLEVL